jgi:hypothetical protein
MSAEPFVITSQNTDNLSWFQGQSINWSVNTQYIAGSANVDIRLSVMWELLFYAIGK